jgi:hypothetical protein
MTRELYHPLARALFWRPLRWVAGQNLFADHDRAEATVAPFGCAASLGSS